MVAGRDKVINFYNYIAKLLSCFDSVKYKTCELSLSLDKLKFDYCQIFMPYSITQSCMAKIYI